MLGILRKRCYKNPTSTKWNILEFCIDAFAKMTIGMKIGYYERPGPKHEKP